MPSFKLSKVLRRDPSRPSLKARVAAVRATASRVIAAADGETDQARRFLVTGTLASAVALPTLASHPHPDQELLKTQEAFLRAQAAARDADCAYRVARRAVYAVLARCPTELKVLHWEYECVAPSFRASPFRGAQFRWIPPRREQVDEPLWTSQAWTGPSLRAVIARAVPALGRGGQTPHHIRRWKASLPIADAFDAEVSAVEIAVGYWPARRTRNEARAECERLRQEISGRVATTPEGMAALVRVIGEYPWTNAGGAWPNLLRSAAIVTGVRLAEPEADRPSSQLARA